MKRLLLVLGAVLALAIAPLLWFLFVVSPRVRGDLVTMLAERYGQLVTIEVFDWHVWPSVAISGKNLTVRRHASESEPPRIAVEHFRLVTTWRDILSTPRRMRHVEVTGLSVTVPPRAPDRSPQQETHDGQGSESATASDGDGKPATPVDAVALDSSAADPIVIDRLVATDARIQLVSSRPDKPSRVFEVPTLTLGGLSSTRPVSFEASVINPTPPGRVKATGQFGPWNRGTPGRTAIAGRYTFEEGDLDVFSGVSGTLAARGTFEGVLNDLRVTGEASIPDFALSLGQPQELRATFTARVSERGGDVELEPVVSAFAATALDVRGTIVRSVDVKGRTIDLQVSGDQAQIEDLLRLALKDPVPPISGPMQLRTRLLLPAGPAPVVDKMRLAGEFEVRRARFANTNVQRTLERISRIGRGSMEPTPGEGVVSDLAGVFTLVDGVLDFERIRFSVPGFAVQLVGSYGLESQELDLAGRVMVAAGPSQLARGRGSRLLDVADRLLAPESGSGLEVPISITGPRTKPVLRVDAGALKRGLGGNVQRNLNETLRSLLPSRSP